MNKYLMASAVLALVVGGVHSAFGEWLIFRRLRVQGLVPTQGGDVLRERHVRILWASWHIVTVFGWGFAAILVWLALASSSHEHIKTAAIAIGVTMLAASLLVLVGTKGKHPGWVGLLGVAVLALLGQNG
jgi:hypothetical protein